MTFLLKKFVSFWLMPLPFCLTLLIAGWLISRTPARRRLGRGLLAVGIGLLVVFGNKWVSIELLHPLEAIYPAMPELAAGTPLPPALARCRYVVVLGGGHADTLGLAAMDKLSASALFRITEGMRLLRLLPNSRLIVSGPAVGNNPSHAQVLTATAISLGIDPARIGQIDTARDTEDEAHAVRALAGDLPIALVTSAWHMPRAATRFRQAGVDFLPCPTDFAARRPAEFRWSDASWDVESLIRSTFAVREQLGYLWLRLRGRA